MSDKIPQGGKLAPHSQEAEEAVLGSVLTFGPKAFEEVVSLLKAGDFFILRNGWVWEAMTRLHGRGDDIEYLTVIEELRSQGRLEDIGGTAYITSLISNTSTSLRAEVYGRIVERAATRRRLLEAASLIERLALTEDEDIHSVLARADSVLAAVTGSSQAVNGSPIVTASEATSAFYDELEARVRGDAPAALKTGLGELDRVLDGGLRKGELIVVGARPGMGKTSLMTSVALNVMKAGGRVGFFSLEMSITQLMERIAAMQTGIGLSKFRLGQLDDAEWRLWTEASAKLAQLPLFIDETPSITFSKLKSSLIRMTHDGPLDLVVIDYLQLMNGRLDRGSGVARDENRDQEIGFITRALKEIAKTYHVPVIVGSQLNREVEKRQDKRPTERDLRESGNIEQDSDVIIGLYRDDKYDEASERLNEADAIVLKNRNGSTGTATLFYRKHLTQFVNLHRTPIEIGF